MVLPATAVVSGQILPVDVAAEMMGTSVEDLRRQAETGTIMAGMINGTLMIGMTSDPETPRPIPGPVVVKPQEEQPDLPLAVAGDDVNARLASIRREDFTHLEGQAISTSQACDTYGVRYHTLMTWVRKGYIKIIRKGSGRYNPTLLDHADVAFCATVHRVRRKYGVGYGAPLLDESGRPYLLKVPELSLARRRRNG